MKKTTTRKTTLRQKITAVILSAVTACSVSTMAFTTTAFAAGKEPDVSLGLNITDSLKVSMDKDLLTAVNITSGIIFKVLEECTPWGKFVTPALNVILGSVIGTPEDPTQQKLDEINDKLDKLFEKIDASEAAIKTSIETDLGLQSFYETFVRFKSMTENMKNKIENIMKENLTNLEKMAKIASLTGSYSEWRSCFEDVLTTLNSFYAKPSITASGSIFNLVYSHYVQSVMFSGEALDKARPICDYLLQVYTAGCTTLLESLSAQLFVNCLTDETKAMVPKDIMAHICNSAEDIYSEIRMISQPLMGDQKEIEGFIYSDGTVHAPTHEEIAVFEDSDGNTADMVKYDDMSDYQSLHPELHIARFVRITGRKLEAMRMEDISPVYVASPDTIRYLYNATMNMSRSILVNYGHHNIQLRGFLDVLNHKSDPNANGYYGNDKGARSVKWFNDHIGNSSLHPTLVQTISDYARGKGISIRTLLNNNGFDTSNLPANTNIVTKKAWDASTNTASSIIGYNYQQSFYKGISIDDAKEVEKDIQVLDCGFNVWTDGEWSFAKAGFACRFALA